MGTGLQLDQYLLAPPSLPTGRHFGEGKNEISHETLASLFRVVAALRTALARQEALFKKLAEKIESERASTAELEALADSLQEHRKIDGVAEAAAEFRQRARRVGRNARSLMRLSEELADFGAAWSEAYENLEIRLRKLASDRDPTAASPAFSDGTAAVRYLRSIANE
jgi:hypothetical protein